MAFIQLIPVTNEKGCGPIGFYALDETGSVHYGDMGSHELTDGGAAKITWRRVEDG
jgi:hypothetical protein